MSDKLVETSPGGGETNQYESINTFMQPHAKQGGQLSEAQTSTETSESADPSRAEKPAENTRDGQAMSEQGMGAQTNVQSTEGNVDAGFGGTEANEDEGSPEATRKAQGYGPGTGIGA